MLRPQRSSFLSASTAQWYSFLNLLTLPTESWNAATANWMSSPQWAGWIFEKQEKISTSNYRTVKISKPDALLNQWQLTEKLELLKYSEVHSQVLSEVLAHSLYAEPWYLRAQPPSELFQEAESQAMPTTREPRRLLWVWWHMVTVRWQMVAMNR